MWLCCTEWSDISGWAQSGWYCSLGPRAVSSIENQHWHRSVSTPATRHSWPVCHQHALKPTLPHTLPNYWFIAQRECVCAGNLLAVLIPVSLPGRSVYGRCSTYVYKQIQIKFRGTNIVYVCMAQIWHATPIHGEKSICINFGTHLCFYALSSNMDASLSYFNERHISHGFCHAQACCTVNQ